VVRVAHGKGIGQREVKRNVRALQIRHRGLGLVLNPAVVAAAIPGAVRIFPAGREIGKKRRAQVRSHGPERQQRGRRLRYALRIAVGLLKHGVAGRIQLSGARIVEAAYAAQGTEIVVKRTILMHEDDYMLHVLDGSHDTVGRDANAF
jgi:hypothetical protein